MRRRDREAGRAKRGECYSRIPVDIGTSATFRWLPSFAVRVLLAIAGQYRGINNGGLSLTEATAREWGIARDELRIGLALLKRVRLIDETAPAKRASGRGAPARYALTWIKLNDFPAFNIAATTEPSDAWSKINVSDLGDSLRSVAAAERWLGWRRKVTTTFAIGGTPRDLEGVRTGPFEKLRLQRTAPFEERRSERTAPFDSDGPVRSMKNRMPNEMTGAVVVPLPGAKGYQS